MLSTEQILNAKFTPVSKGTYSAEEVDSFLKSVAVSYENSLNENRELIKKISILADKIESYRNDEEAIKLALLDAHKMAENVNKSAAEKADVLVSDAENKSKIILDGANRQAAQTIDDAREKAKEIVDNARTAVASLTERAQIETDRTISEAKAKAAEIVANAEEKGREIIGTSKQSFEYYSAELEKIKDETSKFKASIEEVCKGQLTLLGSIPVSFVPEAAITVEEPAVISEKVETEEIVASDEIEEEVSEPAEETFDDIIAEIEEDVAEEEHDPSAIALMAEINGLADDVMSGTEAAVEAPVEEIEAESEEFEAEDVNEEPEYEEIEISDDDDDLFSMIEDMGFEDIPEVDSIPASLDDLIPSVPVAEDAADEEEEEIQIELEADEDEEDDDDEFDGFKIDLDEITDDNDDEDDDITSLFDSLFDD
ncbi:MAG: DivIVA domain-containing protein [Clostridia bacterium]|nr:DivIVA domain-containing protein [Clostridia bacterium]